MLSKWLAKDDQGFTLVELMMVIVILAILTGVAVPMVGRMQKNAWRAKLDSLADSLGSAIVFDAMTTAPVGKAEAYTGTSIGQAQGLMTPPDDVEIVGALSDTASSKGLLVVGASDDNEYGVTIKGYAKGAKTDTEALVTRDFSWAQ